jgi:hypothetical protein
MPALPPWIDEQLNRNDGETEMRRQRLESMRGAARPSLSVDEVHASSGFAIGEAVFYVSNESRTRRIGVV